MQDTNLQIPRNDAVQLFTGKTTEAASHGQDHSLFETWYDQFIIQYLTFLLPQHPDILRYVFHLTVNNSTDYYKQFTSLGELGRDLHKAVCFIAYESPTSQNHFIFGLIINDVMLVVNPLGLVKHQNDFTENIGKVMEYAAIKQVYYSTNKLQQDDKLTIKEVGLVSCGPICVELMKKISSMPLIDLLRLFNEWQKQNNAEVDISSLLPESLKNLESQEEKDYINRLLATRQQHLNILNRPDNKPNSSLEEQNQTLQRAITASEQDLVTSLLSKMNLENNEANHQVLATIRQSESYKIFSRKKRFLNFINDDSLQLESDLLLAIKNSLKVEPLLAYCFTFDGSTPLMLAIQHDKKGIVKLLLETGTDLSGGLSIYASAKEYAENIGKSHLAKIMSKIDNNLITQSSAATEKQLITKSPNQSDRKTKKSSKTKVIHLINHYPTQGDGQCFFHAAFGEMINGICQVNDPQSMRNEWHRYLNQFDSLADSNMPLALHSQLEKILGCFLINPAQASSVFHDTTAYLCETIQQRLDRANEGAHLLIGELFSVIQTAPEENLNLIKKLIFNILTRNQTDRVKDTLRLLLGYDLSEEIDEQELNGRLANQLQNTRGKAIIFHQLQFDTNYLKQRLQGDLEGYALLFKPTEYPTVEAYKQKLNSQAIMREFFNDTGVYQAYLTAIKSPSYYIFMEEIPILTSLSNTTIHIWYQEQLGYYTKQTIHPDPTMISWLEDGIDVELPWSNINEIEIQHRGFNEQGLSAGLHFSQVNRQQPAKGHSSIPINNTIEQNTVEKIPDNEPEPAPSTEEKKAAKKIKRLSQGIGALSVVAFIFTVINSILSIIETNKLYSKDPAKIAGVPAETIKSLPLPPIKRKAKGLALLIIQF